MKTFVSEVVESAKSDCGIADLSTELRFPGNSYEFIKKRENLKKSR